MRFYNYPQDNAAQSRTLSLLHGYQPFNQMHAVVLVSIRRPPVMPPVPYSDFRVWWEGKEIIPVVYPVLRLRPAHGRRLAGSSSLVSVNAAQFGGEPRSEHSPDSVLNPLYSGRDLLE